MGGGTKEVQKVSTTIAPSEYIEVVWQLHGTSFLEQSIVAKKVLISVYCAVSAAAIWRTSQTAQDPVRSVLIIIAIFYGICTLLTLLSCVHDSHAMRRFSEPGSMWRRLILLVPIPFICAFVSGHIHWRGVASNTVNDGRPLSQAQADQYLAAAESLESEGLYARAEYHYRQFIAIERRLHPEANFDGILGRILDLQGKHDEANRHYSTFELHYAQERQHARDNETVSKIKQPEIRFLSKDHLIGLTQQPTVEGASHKESIGLHDSVNEFARTGQYVTKSVQQALGVSVTNRRLTLEPLAESPHSTRIGRERVDTQRDTTKTKDHADQTVVANGRLLRILQSIPRAQAIRQFYYADKILDESKLPAGHLGLKISILNLKTVVRDFRSTAASSIPNHNQATAGGIAIEDKYIRAYLSRLSPQVATKEFRFGKEFYSKRDEAELALSSPNRAYSGIRTVRDLMPLQIVLIDHSDYEKLKTMSAMSSISASARLPSPNEKTAEHPIGVPATPGSHEPSDTAKHDAQAKRTAFRRAPL